MDPAQGGRAPRMPLWVKVFIGIGVVGLLLIVVVAAFGGTEHGPRRHLGGSDESRSGASTHTPPTQHSGTHAPAPAAQPARRAMMR